MKLTILGCGTSAYDRDKACSSYHLAAKGLNILLDCGSGSLKRMVEAGIDYFDIDLIVLSHTEHPDHVADFPMLLFSTNYTQPQKRYKPLRVIGPPGTALYFERILSIHPKIAAKSYEISVEEVSIGAITMCSSVIRFQPMSHGGVPTIGVRVEELGKVFSYSADTGPCDELANLVRNSDLALIECSLPSGYASIDNHLMANQVGNIASKAEVERLIITHQYPVGAPDEIRNQVIQEFKGAFYVAKDLDVYEI